VDFRVETTKKMASLRQKMNGAIPCDDIVKGVTDGLATILPERYQRIRRCDFGHLPQAQSLKRDAWMRF
jgi:hypothetical protein